MLYTAEQLTVEMIKRKGVKTLKAILMVMGNDLKPEVREYITNKLIKHVQTKQSR